MTFKKTGVVPIEEIRCGCGAVLPKGASVCGSCKKSTVSIDKDSAGKDSKEVEKSADQ